MDGDTPGRCAHKRLLICSQIVVANREPRGYPWMDTRVRGSSLHVSNLQGGTAGGPGIHVYKYSKKTADGTHRRKSPADNISAAAQNHRLPELVF